MSTVTTTDSTAPPSDDTRAKSETSKWTKGHIPGDPGIWIFIIGDMTLYAVLAGCFMIDRKNDPLLFDQSSNTLHVNFGAVNALLLLVSSLFVALAVHAVRQRIMPRYAPYLFAGAFACAAGFVVNKYFEYSDLLRADHPPDENIFYVYYYVLTGIHLTHLLAGMAVLVFLFRWSRRETPSIRAIESGASFWHVVDLLWMILFALLYLVR